VNSFGAKFSKNFLNIYSEELVDVAYVSSDSPEYTPQVHDIYMTHLALLVRKHKSEVQVEVKNAGFDKVSSTLAINPYGAPGKHFILNVLRISLNPADFKPKEIINPKEIIKPKEIINFKLLFEAVNKKLPVHSCSRPSPSPPA